MHARLALVACSVSLLAASCGGPAPPPGPIVLVVQDGSFPDARSVISPAVLGLELGLEGGGLGVRVVDAMETSSVDLDDPSVVAVVVAPFTGLLPRDATSLAAAGLPIVSLSQMDQAPAAGVWRRFVRPLGAQAIVLADIAVRSAGTGPVCVREDATAWARDLVAAVLTHLGPAQAGQDCDVAVWVGPASGAEALRAGEPAMPLILADAARTVASVSLPGSGRILGVCSCADLTTSADPAAQSFLHRYQAATGLEPGPYAVEGYDAGRLLAAAATSDATREGIAGSLEAQSGFTGLAGRYVWLPDGDLRAPDMRIYEAKGARWFVLSDGSVDPQR